MAATGDEKIEEEVNDTGNGTLLNDTPILPIINNEDVRAVPSGKQIEAPTTKLRDGEEIVPTPQRGGRRGSAAASESSESEDVEVVQPKRKKRKSGGGSRSFGRMPSIAEFGKHPAGEQLSAWSDWSALVYTAMTFAPGWDEEQRASYILLTGGQVLRDTVSMFGLQDWKSQRPFTRLMENIGRHFASLTDPTLTLQALVVCKQKHGESVSEYYARLVKLTKQSGRDDEDFIRTHFLNGIMDSSLRKLAMLSGWGLTEAVTAAIRNEAMNASLNTEESAMRSPFRQEVIAAVNRQERPQRWQQGVGKARSFGGQPRQGSDRQSTNQTQPCDKCGVRVHRNAVCPAIGKKCNGCGAVGHFKRMCRRSSTVNMVNAPPFRSQQVNENGWSD